MLEDMTPRQLDEWAAFYDVEPFGESWRQNSYICAMIGNSFGGKKGGGTFQPQDFMPIPIPDEDQEENKIAADLKAWQEAAERKKRRNQA